MTKKQILYLVFVAILLIYGIIDLKNYSKMNYDVRGFHFVCNDRICEIRHEVKRGKTKYVEEIDITKIEKFSSKLEKIPKTNSQGAVIYADCKDGTSFRLSPIYVKPSVYLAEELLIPLNKKLNKQPINIDIRFP